MTTSPPGCGPRSPAWTATTSRCGAPARGGRLPRRGLLAADHRRQTGRADGAAGRPASTYKDDENSEEAGRFDLLALGSSSACWSAIPGRAAAAGAAHRRGPAGPEDAQQPGGGPQRRLPHRGGRRRLVGGRHAADAGAHAAGDARSRTAHPDRAARRRLHRLRRRAGDRRAI